MTNQDKPEMFESHLTSSTPAWMSLLFHLALATVGPTLGTVVAAVVLSTLGMSGNVIGFLTLGPSFVMPMLLGLALGYAFGRTCYNRAARWVWVIPTILMTAVLVASLANPATRDNLWINMFGPQSRCTSICIEQLFYSAPFLGSLAYAIGIKLRQRGAEN